MLLQGTHTNCATVCIFKFRGNVWEYRKGSLIVTYCDEYFNIRSRAYGKRPTQTLEIAKIRRFDAATRTTTHNISGKRHVYFDLICKYSSQYVTISEPFPYISSKFKNTNGHAVCVGPLL